ncbi:MAG: EF-hand domain-containing protein, partial [Planctomycetota bacterium]
RRGLETLVLASLTVGCSPYPESPDRPALDPGEAGEQAMADYDANGDGRIDREEAEKCPGLLDAFERVDKNGDGVVDADEIAERIRYYSTAGTTIVSGSVTVKIGRRPLRGATVKFEPEPFLGSAFSECVGTTNEEGIALLEGPDAEFPGIYLGMYRVRISTADNGGKESVPAKYNTETILGYEAADDIPLVSKGITFELDRK